MQWDTWLELFMPDDFDKKLKSWKITNLPIIPPEFKLKPIAANKKKFQQLKKQLKRKDIECVINACDAGREGELIFTYVYELAKSTLPAKRLWMLSMTDNAIKEAFSQETPLNSNPYKTPLDADLNRIGSLALMEPVLSQ